MNSSLEIEKRAALGSTRQCSHCCPLIHFLWVILLPNSVMDCLAHSPSPPTPEGTASAVGRSVGIIIQSLQKSPFFFLSSFPRRRDAFCPSSVAFVRPFVRPFVLRNGTAAALRFFANATAPRSACQGMGPSLLPPSLAN